MDAAGPPAQGTDALLSDIAAEDGAGDSGDSGDCEVSEGAGCPSLGDDDALGDAGPPGR